MSNWTNAGSGIEIAKTTTGLLLLVGGKRGDWAWRVSQNGAAVATGSATTKDAAKAAADTAAKA